MPKSENELVRAMINFRSMLSTLLSYNQRAWTVAQRALFFLLLLFAIWTANHFLARWLLPNPNGFFVQLIVSLASIGGASTILIYLDWAMLKQVPAGTDHLMRSGISIRQAVSGGLSLFVLFIASWAAVYLLFDTLGWEGPQSNYVEQLLAFLLCMVVAYGILLPIGVMIGSRIKAFSQELSAVTQRIAAGDFSASVPRFSQKAHTDFDKVAENLNLMTDSLRRLEDLRQGFVANVSHEIQTPLTTIVGFAQALKNPDLPADARQRYLGFIEDEARRLSRMSDNLLKLGSLDSRTRSLQTQSFRLDSQLRETILTLEPLWRSKRIDISAELSTAWVNADQDLLAQVWINLIQNALKFTPEGGTIVVSLNQDPQTYHIRIADTGLGLAESDRAHVFERFFRAESSRPHNQEGTGLGLALVQAIVGLHGGTVQAESPGSGQGSVFTVTIPRESKNPDSV